MARFDVELAGATAGAWVGESGNAPASVTGIWAGASSVIAVGAGFVLRSDDGGVHFVRVDVPELTGFPVVWGSARGPIFAAGDHLLRSDDRGGTWRAVGQPPGSVSGIWGDGEGVVYAVGGVAFGPPFIARSRDAGATWTALPHPVKDGWFYAAAGRGRNEVIVAGKERLAALSKSGQQKSAAVVLRSTDAGKSWKRLGIFSSTTTEYEQSRGVCLTKDQLFVASSYALYVTKDWGKSYRRATSVGAEVLSLGCHGDDVLVGGRNRTLFSSRDGGATWDEPLTSRFSDPALVNVEVIAFDEAGQAFVGFEGFFRAPRRGTLFRRQP